MKILMVTSEHQFRAHGGVGNFIKGFSEMCDRLGWQLHHALDREESAKEWLVDYCKGNGDQFFSIEQGPYRDHQAAFIFADTLCLERAVAMRESVLLAFEQNVYDAVVVNTVEGTLALSVTRLREFVPVIHYTHWGGLVIDTPWKGNVYTSEYNEVTRELMRIPGNWIGTQSAFNVETMDEHFNLEGHYLPMPFPERGLLGEVPNFEDREGVLFIGRFEDLKNPNAFVSAVSKAGLKALVMTNQRAVPKWEKAFREAGISEFEIKAGIHGKEKVDFIKQARVAFHPSKHESYGFLAMETLCFCPTVVIEDYLWWQHFDGIPGLILADANQDISSLLKEIHTRPEDFLEPHQAMHWKTRLDMYIPEIWEDFIVSAQEEVSRWETPPSNASVSKLIKEDQTISVGDYYSKFLGRKRIGYDDVYSLLKGLNVLSITQEEERTVINFSKPEVVRKQEKDEYELF